MIRVFYTAILTLSCSLFFLPKSYAQVDLGTKLGMTSTSISANNSFADRNRYSYQAGLYLNFETPTFVSVQAEILYNRTRFEYIKEVDGMNPGIKKMGYWSLPVLLQLKPLEFFKIGAGPQLNLHSNSDKYQLDNNVKAFKNYLSFVANAQLKVGHTSQLYFRYNKGLTSFENLNDGRKGKINRFEFGIQKSITKR